MANKKRKRRAWSKEDLKEFKALARKKTSAKVIAKALKRTVGTIRTKAWAMGMSLDSRG